MTMVEIEEIRTRTKFEIKLSVFLLTIRLLIAYWAYEEAGVVASTGAKLGVLAIGIGSGALTSIVMLMLLRTYWDFHRAWAAFYTRRYVPFLRNFVEEGYYAPWTVSKWRFLRVERLDEFERTLIEGLRAARIAIDRERQQERWVRIGYRMRLQLDALLSEYNIKGDESIRIHDDFAEILNPRRKAEFMESLGARLAYDRWKSNQPSVPTRVALESRPTLEDVELRSLEVRASKVLSREAIAEYVAAKAATTRREQIRLFARSLSIDQKIHEDDSDEVAVATSTKAELAVVKHTSLGQFSREKLDFMEHIILGADWKMCREIVLVLLEPGRRGGRFNKRYFAEDTVSVEVRRRYQLNTSDQFTPSKFSLAVKALLANGVIVTKPKTDERTLSLSTRVKGATPEAARIITAILRLKREVTGFV